MKNKFKHSSAPHSFTENKERDGIKLNGDAGLREANSAVSENELINFLNNLKPNTMKHANQSNFLSSFHLSLIQKGKRKMFFLLVIFFTIALSPSYNFAQSPGTLDASFNTGTGANGAVHSMAIQSDGKIVIVGAFTSYNGTAINRVARLNADGTLDATFNPGGSGASGEVYAIAIQSDDKILICGLFGTYNGTAKPGVARLNADGTLDAGFNTGGSGPNSYVLSVAVQSDGKIMIGGYFTKYNGTSKVRIARLNADGTLDAGFNTGGSGPNSNIWSIAVQSDGKVLIGGLFTTYNGAAAGRNIARLNADGTLDATFVTGTGTTLGAYVYSIVIQSDGKILIGGTFTDYNGTARNRIARLNTNGTLDASFNPGTGADNTVRLRSIQSDGKILIGGFFTTYNGTVQNRIARLNADGTLDATFDTGTGADNTVSSKVIQSDGKILICGSFTSYNGTTINRIARLFGDVISTPPCQDMVGGTATPAYSIICTNSTQELNSSGSGDTLQWQSSTNNTTWTDVSGATNATYTTPNGATTPFTGVGSTVYYRCMVKSSGCYDVSSTTAAVSVSQPTITVSVTGKTDNNVTLDWSPVGGGNYDIDYDGTSSGSGSSVTPPYTISGLTASGTYNITVTQTGLSCSASGTLTGVKTLCAVPTGVTLSSPANKKLQVDWTGDAGDYRVYYREIVIQGGYLYKDVTTTGPTGTTTISVMYSGTYEAYVVRKDCPTPGVFGQKSALAHTTVKPLSACTPAPTINEVKSTCPGQIEVSMSGSPTGNYTVFIQRLTPTVAGAYKYNVNGGTFQIHVGQPGQTFLVGVASKCISGTSDMVMYPGGITIKPLCNPIGNLVLSNATCNGFTASWNREVCSENLVSTYQLFMKKTGALTWNSYPVNSPAPPTSPFIKVNWLGKGYNMSCYVKANYSCNGYVIGGPSSATQTITTLSSGCREEEENVLEPETPSTQIISSDNSEAISINPNPNNGQFQLDISRMSNDQQQVMIEVMNVLGQTVLTRISEVKDGHRNEIITLPETTAAGTYFVRVTSGNNIYTVKVNVSR